MKKKRRGRACGAREGGRYSQRRDIGAEIGRAGDFKRLAVTGWVSESLTALELMIRRAVFRGQPGGFRAVARVAEHRMADMRRVNAELMRPPGDGEKADERRRRKYARPGSASRRAGRRQNRAGEAVGGDAAIGASITPSGAAGTPQTHARYSLCGKRLSASAAECAPARRGSLAKSTMPVVLRIEPVNGVRAAVQSADAPSSPRRARRRERGEPCRGAGLRTASSASSP